MHTDNGKKIQLSNTNNKLVWTVAIFERQSRQAFYTRKLHTFLQHNFEAFIYKGENNQIRVCPQKIGFFFHTVRKDKIYRFDTHLFILSITSRLHLTIHLLFLFLLSRYKNKNTCLHSFSTFFSISEGQNVHILPVNN